MIGILRSTCIFPLWKVENTIKYFWRVLPSSLLKVLTYPTKLFLVYFWFYNTTNPTTAPKTPGAQPAPGAQPLPVKPPSHTPTTPTPPVALVALASHLFAHPQDQYKQITNTNANSTCSTSSTPTLTGQKQKHHQSNNSYTNHTNTTCITHSTWSTATPQWSHSQIINNNIKSTNSTRNTPKNYQLSHSKNVTNPNTKWNNTMSTVLNVAQFLIFQRPCFQPCHTYCIV